MKTFLKFPFLKGSIKRVCCVIITKWIELDLIVSPGPKASFTTESLCKGSLGEKWNILPFKMFPSLSALQRTESGSSFLRDPKLVMWHQLLHPFNKHLLSLHYVLSTLIGMCTAMKNNLPAEARSMINTDNNIVCHMAISAMKEINFV